MTPLRNAVPPRNTAGDLPATDRRARARGVPFDLPTVGIGMLVLAVMAILPAPAACAEVWSGRDHYFEKQDYADWTLAENQDRITDQVRITRKNSQGIFNIAQEEGYQTLHSPQDTEWATGDAADWAGLTFQTWQGWAGNYPPGTVGIDAVVHLISEDIYIDIRFDSWTSANLGGGFAYYRADSPTPVESTSWGRIRTLFE